MYDKNSKFYDYLLFEELRGFGINFLNKLHKDEKHQTRVSLSLELISDDLNKLHKDEKHQTQVSLSLELISDVAHH